VDVIRDLAAEKTKMFMDGYGIGIATESLPVTMAYQDLRACNC
jgi:hypothetical protein